MCEWVSHLCAHQAFECVDPPPSGDSATLGSGRLRPRALSGNPGYDAGLPVLAGREVECPEDICTGDDSVKSAIAVKDDGLSIVLPGPGGACLTSAQMAERREAAAALGNRTSFPAAFARVNFGEDLVISCAHTFTLAEFRKHLDPNSNPADFASFCKEDTVKEVLPELYTFPDTGSGNTDPTRIGLYGNSDPLNVDEWAALRVEARTRPMAQHQSNLECDSIYTSRVFEFMYTDIGSKVNPQKRLVGARVIYKPDKWTWRGDPRDGAATQTFETTNVVRFIEYQQPKKTFTPRAPPLLPAIPHDVFYPFDIYGGAPRGRADGRGAALGLGVAAAAAVLAAWRRL